MVGTIYRHRIRNGALGAGVLLLGTTLPLSITRGQEIVGGTATIVVLWCATVASFAVWAASTDWVVSRAVATRALVRSYLPTVTWTPPKRRLMSRRRRRLDKDKVDTFVEMGRMAERARASGVDLHLSEVDDDQVAFDVRPTRPASKPTPVVVSNDHELMEQWMDKEGMPANERSKLRELSAELMQEVAVENAPDHLKHREEARVIREHGEVLEKRLWEVRRDMARSTKLSFPGGDSIPTDYASEVQAWNKRVLDLADKKLSVKEAGAVRVYPKFTSLLGFGPTVKDIDQLFQDNLAVLRRIETMN